MPGLLIGITEPKKRKPLERTGLAPPPFGGSKATTVEDAESPPLDAGESATPLEAEVEEVGPDMETGAQFSQEQVGYCTPGTQCATCDYFEAPNSCEHVQGAIEAGGYCILHSDHGSKSEAIESGAEGIDAIA